MKQGLKDLIALEAIQADPDHTCYHGCTLWWNYGDGKPRHFRRGRPTLQVCDDIGFKYPSSG